MDYFNNRMFNPQYVNPNYYEQIRYTFYQQSQDIEVAKAVKAMTDLCEAVKRMDEAHQVQAFNLCFAKMAEEFHWN